MLFKQVAARVTGAEVLSRVKRAGRTLYYFATPGVTAAHYRLDLAYFELCRGLGISNVAEKTLTQALVLKGLEVKDRSRDGSGHIYGVDNTIIKLTMGAVDELVKILELEQQFKDMDDTQRLSLLARASKAVKLAKSGSSDLSDQAIQNIANVLIAGTLDRQEVGLIVQQHWTDSSLCVKLHDPDVFKAWVTDQGHSIPSVLKDTDIKELIFGKVFDRKDVFPSSFYPASRDAISMSGAFGVVTSFLVLQSGEEGELTQAGRLIRKIYDQAIAPVGNPYMGRFSTAPEAAEAREKIVQLMLEATLNQSETSKAAA